MVELRHPFQWDEQKNADCWERRGFNFEFAIQMWRGAVREKLDNRRDYGECRIQALGQIEGQYYVVVYTWRDERRHIISARRAHMKEVLKWAGSS